MKQLLFFAAIGLIIVFGIFQHTELLSLNRIKPNVLLVAVCVFSFFTRRFPQFFILLLSAAVFLAAPRIAYIESFTFVIIGVFCFVAGRVLPGKPFLNMLILVAAATILLYGVSDWRFLLRAPSAITFEVFYNMVAGILLYVCSRRFTEHEERYRASF